MEKPLLCIGHRGAKGYAPENTLASFRKAIEMGAHCVELDVYFADGQLVVIHDDDLERTTNGTGKVMERTFEYLRRLDCGNGEQMPTLNEVMALVDQRVGVNIELKGPGTAEPVMDLVRELRSDGWFDDLLLLSSFDHSQLVRARELDPGIQLGVLYYQPPPDGLEFTREIGARSLNVGAWFVDLPMVRAAQSIGLQVFVYTVNEPEDIRRMRELGVDGVFSDYPDRVLDSQPPGSDLPAGWPGSSQ